MKKKNIEGYITASDRLKAIKDFNYGEIVSNGFEEFDLPRMSTIEYHNGVKVFEDYTELDLYLEEHFIPTYLKKVTNKNVLTNEDEKDFVIPLNRIVDLKLSHDEFEHVCNYLEKEGIIIRGRSSTIDDISNYEYTKTYKSHLFNDKYEKNLEEEIEMFKELRKTNDKKIREKIILNNIRIVYYLANKYASTYDVDNHELESYAFEALCKAVDNFDYTKGYNFSAYAFSKIKSELKSGIADIKNNYRAPHLRSYYYNVLSYILKVEREKNQKIKENQNLINNVLDLMIKDGIITLRQRDTFKKYIYSNLILSFDTDNVDILLDNNYGDVDRDLYLKQLKSFFDEILVNKLSEREFFIIKNRFGFGGEKPKLLEELGKELGLTRERIRQIESVVLLRLRTSYSRKLREFLKDSIDIDNTIDLYGYIDEETYNSDDIYDDNYDYKKPPRR